MGFETFWGKNLNAGEVSDDMMRTKLISTDGLELFSKARKQNLSWLLRIWYNIFRRVVGYYYGLFYVSCSNSSENDEQGRVKIKTRTLSLRKKWCLHAKFPLRLFSKIFQFLITNSLYPTFKKKKSLFYDYHFRWWQNLLNY